PPSPSAAPVRPHGYDVAEGVARFEASLGMTTAASSGSPSEIATGNSVAGNGISTAGSGAFAATGTSVGFKGMLMASAGACLIVGAAASGYNLYARSVAERTATKVVTVPAVAASVRRPAFVPETVSAAREESSVRDTDLTVVSASSSSKGRAAPSSTVPKRALEPIEPSALDSSVRDQLETTPGQDASSKSLRSTELAAEMEQLTGLRAIAASDPTNALRRAEDGDRRFPKGLFRQERQAIAIQSLVKLNRVNEAKQRARSFKAAYPRSPLLAGMNQLLSDAGD
ncbi:MAG TPA: hypothetical protein VIV60_28960, partial [Polyangiaceae bacterium]